MAGPGKPGSAVTHRGRPWPIEGARHGVAAVGRRPRAGRSREISGDLGRPREIAGDCGSLVRAASSRSHQRPAREALLKASASAAELSQGRTGTGRPSGSRLEFGCASAGSRARSPLPLHRPTPSPFPPPSRPPPSPPRPATRCNLPRSPEISRDLPRSPAIRPAARCRSPTPHLAFECRGLRRGPPTVW